MHGIRIVTTGFCWIKIFYSKTYDIANDDSYESNGNIYDENIQILVKDKRYIIRFLVMFCFRIIYN